MGKLGSGLLGGGRDDVRLSAGWVGWRVEGRWKKELYRQRMELRMNVRVNLNCRSRNVTVVIVICSPVCGLLLRRDEPCRSMFTRHACCPIFDERSAR